MEKEFRCTIAGCVYAFATNDELVSHLRSFHSRSVCTEVGCGKVFSTRDGLSKHIQSIHRGVRYSCECGGDWGYADNYYQHLPCSFSSGTVIKTTKTGIASAQPKFASEIRKEKEKAAG